MTVVRLGGARPFHLGLLASIALLAASPIIASTLCPPPPGAAGGCPGLAAAVFAATLATIAAHELVHLAAARLLRVPGARLRFEKHMLALMLDYDYMTPGQYFIVAAAPQLLTAVLLPAAGLAGGLGGYLACIAGLVNLAGGAPDVVNALYFRLVHGDARRFTLLYGPDGSVEGGVVEEADGSLTVYVMRRWRR